MLRCWRFNTSRNDGVAPIIFYWSSGGGVQRKKKRVILSTRGMRISSGLGYLLGLAFIALPLPLLQIMGALQIGILGFYQYISFQYINILGKRALINGLLQFLHHYPTQGGLSSSQCWVFLRTSYMENFLWKLLHTPCSKCWTWAIFIPIKL